MIEKLIDTMVATLKPIDGKNLLGFQCDLRAALSKNSTFTDPKIEVTSDPRCIFDVRATVANHVDSLQALSRALKQVFVVLGYNYFRASSLQQFREATVLRFVTNIEKSGYFVTGRIEVGGGPYAALVERFERDFGWDGPLPSLGQSHGRTAP